MKIVTGYTGTPHVSSNDDQGLHQGIFGSGNNVLNVGNKFAAVLTDATTIEISDGEGVLQGVHFRVDPGTVDTVTIDAGVVGYNRIDLICARYTKDANSGIESVDWHVIKGTSSASTPATPSAETGDVLDGDLVADFPMYKVTLTGVTPVIGKLFNIFRRSTTYSINIAGNSGHVDKSFEPGIYAISGSVGAGGDPVQSGSQQRYEIYAHANNFDDQVSMIKIDDKTGKSLYYFNGVIVVEEAYPYISFDVYIASSGITGVDFDMNITKIA